jgi:hypothetical protein
VKNVLSSNLILNNIKLEIYITIILRVVLYGCETWSLTLREERRLRVFENKSAEEDFLVSKGQDIRRVEKTT